MLRSFHKKYLCMISILFLIPLLFATALYAGDVTLSWTAPVMNEDGTSCTDLDGYIIYYGTTSGVYFDNIDVIDENATSYPVTNLTNGLTYYFVITSYDTSGNESVPSAEESITINSSPPPAPEISVADSVSPASDLQISFGNVADGTTSNQTVTITNDGSANLLVGSIAQSNVLVAPFSILSDYCSGQTLTPLSTCTLTVRFAPTSVGTFSDSFDIPSNDPNENPLTFNISGIGEALPVPDITVTDSVAPVGNHQIPFGSITEGNSANQTVTITNDGNADLVIGSIAQENPLAAPFSITSNNCSGQTISPSSNCTLTVRFAPSASGSFSDSFNIPSNDSDENPIIVSVNGTGNPLPVPDITVTDSVAPIDNQQIPFGSVTAGSSANKTVTITNDGNADLVIGSIAQDNPLAAPFSITSNNCSGQTISPSSNCTLTVRFAPSASGSFSDSFNIPSNDSDENPVTVSVNGTGIPPLVPDITVTDSLGSAHDLQIPFADLTEGLSSDEIITITNNGGANLSIGSIAQNNPLAAPFQIINDNCTSQTLSPSSNCTLTVRFFPITMGLFSDSLDIPSNDPDEDPVTVAVSGTGLSSGTNNPPTEPVAIYPANGQEGVGSTVEFEWEESTDPDHDAITYYLYYSEDSDFTDISPVVIASLGKNDVHYAGIGSYGTVLVTIALFSLMIGIKRNRRKMLLLVVSMIMAGMLLVSCGEIDDMLGDIVPFMGNSGGSVSQIVSGLDSESYCWKVVADDGNGGESESSVNCFGT